MLLATAGLPLITVALAALRPHLNLDDDLLIYLVAVVTITVLGGFWPAVLAAVAASLLLNWYFTPPIHTFTIEQPHEPARAAAVRDGGGRPSAAWCTWRPARAVQAACSNSEATVAA